MTSQKGRLAVASAALLLSPLVLSGCTTTMTCVLWIGPQPAQETFDAARLVVVGTPLPSTTSAPQFGLTVPLHTIQVEEVLKGDYEGAQLEVMAAPQTCPGPGVDPLATGDRVVLFLNRSDGVWMTVDPSNGLLRLPQGEPLPFQP